MATTLVPDFLINNLAWELVVLVASLVFVAFFKVLPTAWFLVRNNRARRGWGKGRYYADRLIDIAHADSLPYERNKRYSNEVGESFIWQAVIDAELQKKELVEINESSGSVHFVSSRKNKVIVWTVKQFLISLHGDKRTYFRYQKE